MTLQDDKMALFKDVALKQGYDPGEVESFTKLGAIAQKEKESFDPTSDESFQEWLLKEKYTRALETETGEDKAKLEAENYLSLGGQSTKEDYDKLSIDAKANLRNRGVAPNLITGEEKDARKNIQGLLSTLDTVKDLAGTINVGNIGLSKLGLSADLQNFETKKFLINDFLIRLVADNRITDNERESYNKKVLALSALGSQKVKEERIESLKRDIITLSGYDPSEFRMGLSKDPKDLQKEVDGGVKNQQAQGLPPTPGQTTGQAVDIALSKVNDVARFFFPQTTELIVQGFQGKLPKMELTPGQKIMGPQGLTLRDDQYGKAARELSLAAALDFATMGALKWAKPLLGKVAGPVEAVMKDFYKSSPMVQSFLGSFTIPTKLAKSLNPIKTARELVEDGIHGSAGKLTQIVDNVTGANGIITRLTRDALGQIDNEIPVSNALTAARNIINQSLEIDDKYARKILGQISGKIQYGKEIGKMYALDAFDYAKKLESLGHQYLNASTYLTKNIKAEDTGRVLLAAADEIIDTINRTVREQDIISKVLSQESISNLTQVSSRLADKVMNAKTFSELRSVAAPYVNLGRMLALTEQAAQSVAQNATRQIATRASQLCMAGIGTAVAGLPGTMAGFLAAPFLEVGLQGIKTPLLTGAAQVAKKLLPQSLPKVPPVITKAVESGLRVIPQAIRGALGQPGGGGNPHYKTWMYK